MWKMRKMRAENSMQNRNQKMHRKLQVAACKVVATGAKAGEAARV